MSSTSTPHPYPQGTDFWLILLAAYLCNFISALDVSAVSTALPTITTQLHGNNNFVWIGAAYNLAAAALLPLSGRIADLKGRLPVMPFCLCFFFIGSIVASTAHSMNVLIAARTIQGIGAGGMTNLATIIISDIVPLEERGIYQVGLALTWTIAAGIGPLVGGTFAEKVTWRWLFYLNLPLSVFAFCFVLMVLWRGTFPRKNTSPDTHWGDKLDLFGNLFIIVGTTLALIALTWGGIRYPWDSPHVLVLLITGFAFIGFFFLYEFLLYKKAEEDYRTLPLDTVNNLTGACGYAATFFHGIVSISTIFYLPVYFQACMAASPIRSSVNIFPTAFVISPFAMLSGVIVKLTKKYLLPNYAGWVLIIIGFGLLSHLKADSSTAAWVCFQIVSAAGVGIIWASTIFPILAPLPRKRNAAAVTFYNFCRIFAQTWGVSIVASILQNQLKNRLPPAFTAQFPEGVEIAYAAIPFIHTLEEPLQTEVRNAFASSLSVVWLAMIGFSVAGLATTACLKPLPLQDENDKLLQQHTGSKPRVSQHSVSTTSLQRNTVMGSKPRKSADEVEMTPKDSSRLDSRSSTQTVV